MQLGLLDGTAVVGASFLTNIMSARSAVAFGKLHGVLDSNNPINIGLLAGNAVAGAAFLTTGDPATGVAALGATTALGGVMGAHMTASIGGRSDLSPLHSSGMSLMLLCTCEWLPWGLLLPCGGRGS